MTEALLFAGLLALALAACGLRFASLVAVILFGVGLLLLVLPLH